MNAMNPSSTLRVGHASPSPAAMQRMAPTGRPLAALLLAAAIAALAVAGERLMASWADEHLLATWVALWAVVFAGSLLLAGTARRTAQRVMGGLDRWARLRAEARAEARALLLARHDPRLMAEIQAARDQAEIASPIAQTKTASAAKADGHADEWSWSGLEVVTIGGQKRHLSFYL